MEPYVTRNFRGGISDENDRGIDGSFKFGYGLNIHSRDNALLGGSSAATIFDATTGETGAGSSARGTTLNSHFNIIVPSFDGSTYFFGATGSIFARSGDGFITNVYNDDEGITGAAEFGFSDGATYMFWGKSTSIARRQMGGTFDTARDSGKAIWSNATQVWKTEKILSTAVWHTMVNASGSLMMANGEGLSVVDFDGNFDPIKMSVRPGNLINALEERDDYVIFGSEREDFGEEGHLWSWIVTALNYVQKKRVPVFGVNALITAEMPLLQGGENGEIFPADFVNSVPLAAVPGGGRVIPSGVTVHEDLATFGFFGGTYPGIWTYGRSNVNRPPALNYQYRLAPTVGGSTVGTIGALSVVNGTLLASWGTTETDSSAYGVDAIRSTVRASYLYESLEFDKGTVADERMVDSVIVFWDTGGTSFSIKYRTDKENPYSDGSYWRYVVWGDGSTTYTNSETPVVVGSLGAPARILEYAVEGNASGSGSGTAKIHEVTFYLADRPNAY